MNEAADVPDEMVSLLRILQDRTESKSILWDKGSSDTEFVFSRNSGSVIVSSVDGDGAQPFEISILDTNGRRVESYNTASTPSLMHSLGELYQQARRTTVRSSPVVTDLIKEFHDDDIPF